MLRLRDINSFESDNLLLFEDCNFLDPFGRLGRSSHFLKTLFFLNFSKFSGVINESLIGDHALPNSHIKTWQLNSKPGSSTSLVANRILHVNLVNMLRLLK